LAAENERLDGTATAAQSRAAELELAVAHTEEELNRIRTEQEQSLARSQAALIQASAQAAQALQELAEVQTARSAEVAGLGPCRERGPRIAVEIGPGSGALGGQGRALESGVIRGEMPRTFASNNINYA